MTCPHAEHTTLLWLYGEHDEAHIDHVVTCAECSRIAETHTDVLCAIAETAPALRQRDETATRVRKPRRMARPALAGLTLAAAWLLVFRSTPSPVSDVPPLAEPTVVAQHVPEPPFPLDPLDQRLDTLQDELLSLSLDLEVL